MIETTPVCETCVSQPNVSAFKLIYRAPAFLQKVDNYQYELPSDFEDEEIDEDMAFTAEDKERFGSMFGDADGDDAKPAKRQKGAADELDSDQFSEEEAGDEYEDEDEVGGSSGLQLHLSVSVRLTPCIQQPLHPTALVVLVLRMSQCCAACSMRGMCTRTCGACAANCGDLHRITPVI